ncbi:SMP-30/Gluconolaconase/LRE-like region domain-containing protein [Phthorimaea operculella]|nr:SMP-30/Gluconolaconase/LRE-like region domain-containing protein [Phthorimaea operculella]
MLFGIALLLLLHESGFEFACEKLRPCAKETFAKRIGSQPDPVDQGIQMIQWAGANTSDVVVEYMNETYGHAESPAWDPDTNTLYWVDVLNQTLHAMDYNTKKHTAKSLKQFDCGELNVVLPVKNSKQLLVACKEFVAVMDWDQNTYEKLARLGPKGTRNVVNEGKCDANGRLWAGTKGPQNGDEVEEDRATLYKLVRPCYRPRSEVKKVTISNGLVWSLNNSLLYYIDSDTNTVDVFQFDLEKGELGERRTVLNTTDWGYLDAIPDGMTIDRDGFLWVALHRYGQVIRINPDTREIVTVYSLPVARATSMTWVGKDLEDLAITTSKRNVPEAVVKLYPLSGTVFFLKGLGTGGVLANKCTYDPQDKC